MYSVIHCELLFIHHPPLTEEAYHFLGIHTFNGITLINPFFLCASITSLSFHVEIWYVAQHTRAAYSSTLQGVWSCSALVLCSTGASLIYNVMPAGSEAEQSREEVEVKSERIKLVIEPPTVRRYTDVFLQSE